MSRHAAPSRSWRLGCRLTVPAVHLIVGRPMPSPTAAGQSGRHSGGAL
jgi:hypothetical protein